MTTQMKQGMIEGLMDIVRRTLRGELGEGSIIDVDVGIYWVDGEWRTYRYMGTTPDLVVGGRRFSPVHVVGAGDYDHSSDYELAGYEDHDEMLAAIVDDYCDSIDWSAIVVGMEEAE